MTFDGPAQGAPGGHAALDDLDLGEAALRQQGGGLGGAAVGAADQGDGAFGVVAQVGQALGQLLQGQVEGPVDVPLFAVEVGGGAHVQHQQGLARVQAGLEPGHLHHGLLAQAGDQPRQEGEASEQGKRDQALLDQPLAAGRRLAPRVAEPGVGEGPGQHADIGGDQIVQEGDAGEPQGVVQQVEGEERDQPGEGDEAPALGLHALHQTPADPAGLGLDPIGRQVAGDQEGECRPDGGPGQVVEGPPHRTEQGPAYQGEHRPREEQDGRDGIDGHEHQGA